MIMVGENCVIKVNDIKFILVRVVFLLRIWWVK